MATKQAGKYIRLFAVDTIDPDTAQLIDDIQRAEGYNSRKELLWHTLSKVYPQLTIIAAREIRGERRGRKKEKGRNDEQL